MIRRRSSLVGLAARTAVITKTASAVSHSSAQKQQQRAAAQQLVSDQNVVAQGVTGGVVDDKANLMSQLQELANLHTQGLLTAEEFSAAKAKLLA